ncbi:MAG TPA: FAD-dependent oxidoreductase [Epsilonproteobacteria bacterium]|nr:FAD-dependent oxidoreductase [Campylobacterota bacterium]
MLYDVVVVGSGISGLYAALYAKRSGAKVAVVTKANPMRSNSAVASGGINAVINPGEYDSYLKHAGDTIAGADGLVHEQNIKKMCEAAPHIVQELAQMGVGFDTREDETIAQRPFGGGSAVRTCYIADRTGAAIVMSLLQQCRKAGITLLTNYQLLNIIKHEKRLAGISVLRRSDSQVIALACKSLVLAGGGYAGVYRGHSTNAQESSGDVIAAAFRANILLSNMEFVQFHPTTLKTNGALISEAARGEGTYLVDETGKRFTDELQTRDKLSREIIGHIKKGHKVFLDFRHLGEEAIDRKLPSARKMALNAAGIDITKELLEITPSAHYTIGGIWTRPDTSTTMDGVFACGECAVTGVHGANRLGGNSLLEGAYFGRIAGYEAAKTAYKKDYLPIDYSEVEKDMNRVELIMEGENRFNINAMRISLGEMLFRNVGPFRSEETLGDAISYVTYLRGKRYGLNCINKEKENNVELSSILEFHNALFIAEAIANSAYRRKESRGVHYRSDYPIQDNKHFNVASYVRKMGKEFMDITFENAVKIDIWHAIKKILITLKG